MFRMIVQLANSIRAALEHAPTNRFLQRLRARPGAVSTMVAMLAGVAYLFAAAVCTGLLERGAPGSLNAVVLLFVWNGFKLVLHGLVMLAVLARERHRSVRFRRSPSSRVAAGRTPDRPYAP